MKAPVCRMCQKTVVELNGQYELLDSYYLDGPSSLDGTWGEWHLSCLRASPYGRRWNELRARNHLEVRSYEKIAELDSWTVLKNRRTFETLAFSIHGELLGLTFSGVRLRRVDGGSVYADLYEQFHLELDDADVIQQVQARLASAKAFPILSLYELLGIADRVVHPEALEGALFHWQRDLANKWTRSSVSMRCEYGFFVPAELEQYVTRPKTGQRLR